MKISNIIFRMFLLVLYVGGTRLILPDIKINNSIERWLPNNSPETTKYKKFLEEFNSDALLILSIENSDSLFNKNEIDQKILTVSGLDHVLNVTSWPARNIRYKKKKNNQLLTYIIRFEPFSHLNPNRPELISRINGIFTDHSSKVHLAGTGVIYQAINHQTEKAIQNYLLLGIMILCVVLIFLIRSPVPIIQTLFVAMGGIASIIYAAKIFDISISLIHTIIPIIILFYSTSISLHILFHSGDFRKVMMPSLIVVLTTSMGFAVFFFDKTPLLKDFAIIGLSGLMGAFIWSLIIFYPNSYKYEVSQKIIKRFERMPVLSKKWTIPGFLLLTFLFIPGLLKIRAEIYSLSILTVKDKAYRDHVYTESHVGNYFPLEYTVDEQKIDRKQVSRWVNEVYQLSDIDAAIVYYQIPRTLNIRELGYQSKTIPTNFRITFMVPLMSTTEGMVLVDSITNISKKYFENQVPELTGFITLYSNVANELFSSFKQSLILAFIIIYILITLYLRNFKLILFALIVNIFPILAMLGLMGWLGIHLDMVTIPIGCLLISIVVDDTIHLMYWYKMKRNLKDALIQAGPGIFFTTVLLSLGFSILLLSDAPPVAYFAILSLFALATALMGDLILLPSLLKK